MSFHVASDRIGPDLVGGAGGKDRWQAFGILAQQWIVGGVALIVSQAVILSAWSDAKAGTIVNVVLLLAVTHGWFNHGPQSFRAQFERDISSGLARPLQAAEVTQRDLDLRAKPREG